MSSEGMGRTRLVVGFRYLIVGGNELAGGVRHPPASHLVLLVATPLILASSVVYSVADVDVVAFAFQLAGVVVVTVMFAGASVTGSVFLVAYEVVGMSREGDDATDLPNVIYSLLLRQPFFVSAARVSHWPLLAS